MSATRPATANGSSRPAGARQAPRYAPLAHPGSPGRWNDEAILRALRDWTDETGRAPRRGEWCGEHPGGAEAGQRKWMRDHPYWPSSSCAAAHFGSWGKALEAAGLIGHALDFDESVAERVEMAQCLRADGQRIRAIAEQIGVSVSTVHNYLRAGCCRQCGGPVASPRAERCLACTAHEPSTQRAWTKGGVREAIRGWIEVHGHAPSYHEWTPSRSFPGVWEAESPRWPSAAVVCDAYDEYRDPWNAALRDAGAPVRFRRWSDEAVRAALAGFWARTGRPPVPADLRTPSWEGPTAKTLRRRCGSLGRAWMVLGPVPSSSTEDAHQRVTAGEQIDTTTPENSRREADSARPPG
jgi:hypothetical protein